MSSAVNDRFRVTVWPDVPIPAPTTWPNGPHRIDANDCIALDDPASVEPSNQVSIDGETYLDLVEIDANDDESILRFVNELAILGVRTNGYREFFPWPLFAERSLPVLKASWPDWVARDYESTVSQGNPQMMYGETLAEFRFGWAWMNDLVTSFRIVTDQLDAADAEWCSDFWLSEPDDTSATRFLSVALEAALGAYHPHIRIEPAESSDTDPLPWLSERGIAPYSLFSVLCLQLFNHAALGDVYRRCANATCGRLFIRHRGRSIHGQHRKLGTKFCSRNCASAQSSRDYRRRRRESERTD